MKLLSCLRCIVILQLVAACGASAAEKRPVYVFLHARITDHVNIEVSEDRLRRVLPMLERYRKAHPEAHVKATILLSGAISQALADRNAQTGIKDFVLDYVRRGVIELGYDGTDEPTYKKRPRPDLKNAKTPDERWLARGTAAERFLTEGRDPLTGNPRAGSGGLKKMQEVFGEAACITGVTEEMGSDSEVVQHVGQYNTRAIMFGIPEANPGHIPGYEGSAMGFGAMMSPTPESSPELYWQDNVLRSSEMSDEGTRLVHGDEGTKSASEVLGKLDRSKIHIVHVELGSERIHVRPGPVYPAVRVTYEDPEFDKLPPSAFHDAEEVNAAYAKEDAIIKWLVEDFFPANPGSRFVSSTDLKQMTPSSTGFGLSVQNLRARTADMLKNWGNDTYPPSYVQVEGRFLSLADMFQVMADALAELDRTGKFPQTVTVSKVYGPLETQGDHGPNLVEVNLASVARVSRELADRLHDSTWSPIPKNAIPSRISVDGTEMNATQFLRLMAEALVAPSRSAKLNTKMTYMLTTSAMMYPETRPDTEEGGLWTFKPAPLALETAQASKSGQ